MRHFTVTYGYIVDTTPGGDLRVNSRVYASIDQGDQDGAGARVLVTQANVAAELAEALAGLVNALQEPISTYPQAVTSALARAAEAITKARGI